MKKLVGMLLLASALVSCDYFNDTRVCNQTHQEITLTITFDSAALAGRLGRARETLEKWDATLSPVAVDTVNYKATYTIGADSCGSIEGGNNRWPHFEYFKKLEVVTGNDTVRLNTREQMVEAFGARRPNPEYYFDWVIQEGGTTTR